MTDTLTLTAFLLARIAEDEEVARAARPGPWNARLGLQVRNADGTVACWDCCGGNPSEFEPTQDHIARHDPARALAECAAKRRIVREYETLRALWVDKLDPGVGVGFHALGKCLDALALPYADHPDFPPV